jgi:diguanylate cyclase (GGDEF)-like protein
LFDRPRESKLAAFAPCVFATKENAIPSDLDHYRPRYDDRKKGSGAKGFGTITDLDMTTGKKAVVQKDSGPSNAGSESPAAKSVTSQDPRPRTRLSTDPKSPVRLKQIADPCAQERLDPKEIETLHVLRRASIESIRGLFEHCPIYLLNDGEILLSKGQSNQTMYMILSGRLRVHLDNTDSEPLAYLESGQTVGEISVIDDSPATAHVVAACRTRLLAVNEETFWRAVAASHEFATNLLLLLAQRMRDSNTTIAEGARVRRQLEIDSTVDALTGLYNRRWLEENAPRLVARFHRSSEGLSVIMLDVDHFKSFNDTYGHAAGDQVLSTVGRVLKCKLRPTDLAARYGGEEFIVLLPATSLSGAIVAAERLRKAVAETEIRTADGRDLPTITISLGVTELAREEPTAEFIAKADSALYVAKHKGRNRVETA